MFTCELTPFYGWAKWIHLVFFITFRGTSACSLSPRLMYTCQLFYINFIDMTFFILRVPRFFVGSDDI